MTARRIVGLALVAIGMVILLWGGIFWRDRDTVVDAGPLEKVQTSERKGVALPPLLGAGVLVAGIILVVVAGRRTT